jgi:hypothetical protein
MTTLKKSLFILSLFIFCASCSDDDTPTVPLGEFESGFFITNEGPFQNGTGTLSFVGDDAEINQTIFKSTNNEDLGNIVQSMTLFRENAYIVVNNSAKVIVANRYTMNKIATIEGNDMNNPRYFVADGTTGYVSNWGDAFDATDDFIAVVDLISNTVINTVAVGEGPEEMVIDNGKLYVNLQGGFSQNDKVEVIDLSDTSKTTIDVSDVPNSIIKDGNAIWVLCEGKPSFTGDETAGSLMKIENGIATTILTFETTEHPSHLTLDNGNLYYNLGGKVYTADTSSAVLSPTTNDVYDGFYYSMQVNNGFLYITDAGDFASEGTLKVFNLSNNTLERSYTTGIIPGSVVFQ